MTPSTANNKSISPDHKPSQSAVSAVPPRPIRIFDTTLRDGEQSPGASMNIPEKLEIAQALVDLGVDIIEAGFPDRLARRFRSRPANRRQHSRADHLRPGPLQRRRYRSRLGSARKAPRRPRIHVFLATSAIHREFKLKMDKDEIIRRAVAGVKRAVGYCDDVEFSPEDAARTEIDFLCQVVEAAIDAGATTVNIPDTVGYATPAHYGNVIRTLQRARAEHRQGRDQRPLPQRSRPGRGQQPGRRRKRRRASRMHDQRHRRTGRQLFARRSRDGPAHAAGFLPLRHAHQHRSGWCPTSRLVSNITGIQVQRNKAIVGRNAFAHEAGIHQDGMLKEPRTYEIMRPEDVGLSKTDLVLGKHSGRAALADRARALGYHLTGEQLQTVFEQFKQLADKKKEIYDGDIAALCEQQILDVPETWTLSSYHVNCGTEGKPTVRLTLKRGDQELTEEMTAGDGPVDAIFLAIEKITGLAVTLPRFPRPLGHGRQRRPGRSECRNRAQRPGLPRPRRFDRQRRSQRPGVPERHQPRGRHQRPATAPAAQFVTTAAGQVATGRIKHSPTVPVGVIRRPGFKPTRSFRCRASQLARPAVPIGGCHCWLVQQCFRRRWRNTRNRNDH